MFYHYHSPPLNGYSMSLPIFFDFSISAFCTCFWLILVVLFFFWLFVFALLASDLGIRKHFCILTEKYSIAEYFIDKWMFACGKCWDHFHWICVWVRVCIVGWHLSSTCLWRAYMACEYAFACRVRLEISWIFHRLLHYVLKLNKKSSVEDLPKSIWSCKLAHTPFLGEFFGWRVGLVLVHNFMAFFHQWYES